LHERAMGRIFMIFPTDQGSHRPLAARNTC
jgi:hypothetical protein